MISLIAQLGPIVIEWDLIHGSANGLFEQHGGRKRATDFSTGRKLGIRDRLIALP